MAEAKAIALQDLAQSVTTAVLRALASQAEFRTFLGKNGPGLIARPMVTVGGMIYFGEASRIAAGRAISSTEAEMV